MDLRIFSTGNFIIIRTLECSRESMKKGAVVGVVGGGKLWARQTCCKPKAAPCKEFSHEDCETMFKDFWATESKGVQNTFIKSHVQVCRAKRDRRQLENAKQRVNRKYFLSKDGVSTPVCYAMFRNTLGVTEKEVRSLTNDIIIYLMLHQTK